MLADHAVVTRRQFRDELVCRRELRGVFNSLQLGTGLTERNVGRNRVTEQKTFLKDDADVATQVVEIELPHVDIVHENSPRGRVIEPGDQVVVIDSPFGRIGLAVCYDLRFPELFRSMKNVDIIVLPSAFTETTGKMHWEVLVRARAIENLAYVIASAQGGYHVNGRETHGNSMIVDPWGRVLDRLPRGSGVVVADVNPSYQASLRTSLPALTHRILFGCT